MIPDSGFLVLGLPYQVSSRSSANWGHCKLKLTINAIQIECSHHCTIPAPQIMNYIILSDIAPLRRNEWVSLKSVFCYLWNEFITKALESKRPQNRTRHYKIIQRVNMWAKGPFLAWRASDPTNGLHHIHVLGEIANGLIAAASGACICWCPISPIDHLLVKRIWISQ